MTYGRYDNRRGSPESRERWQDEGRHDRDDRGFLDRARDEVASWFGDEPRRDRDDEDRARRERAFGDDRDYDRYERNPRWRDEGYRRPYTGRSASPEPGRFGDDYGPSRAFRNDRWDRGQTDRDRTGREFGAMAASGLHDRDYSDWRRRQIDAFDRDYDEFRKENSSRFESEFSSWRGNRQAKRGLLGQVREHMNVVGSDNEPVGTVDKVRGDRIILTRTDSQDGQHHAVACTMVDRIEGDQVILDRSAAEAKMQLDQAKQNPAMFDRDEDERGEGPHMLNRSFSGTY